MAYIYRASITLRDGTVIYAKDYGKRAFRIPVDEPEEEEKSSKPTAQSRSKH